MSAIRLAGSLVVFLKLGVILPAAGAPASALPSVQEKPLSYSVRVWQTDDGLPQDSVYAIAQTLDGYLWVGTRAGLARFDGVQFKLMEDAAVPELEHAWITALTVTRDGSLWIATDGSGLLRLKDKSFSRVIQSEGLPSNQVRCLLEGAKNQLWIGTEGGLNRYEEGRLTSFATAQALGDNSVRALWEDHQGTLWVATKRGLSVLETGGVFSTMNFSGGWNRNALRAVHQDQRGNTWVGSTDGLHCIESPGAKGEKRETNAAGEGSLGRLYTVAEGLPDNIINCVFADALEQVWIGTYGGLARIINGEVVPWPNRESVFGDLVNTIFADQEGNLWVGGRDGLYRLKPGRFKTLSTEQGLSGNNVISVCEDNALTGMWLGVWGGGVNFLENDKVTVYPNTNVLRDSVLALCQSRQGTLWVGMDFAGGLNTLNAGRRAAYPRQNKLIGAPICAIWEDRQGWLWVGTRAGLNRINEDTIETYSVTNGLPANSVEAICEDAAGDVWIGTGGGLARWRQRLFESFTVRQGLSHNAVTALYADGDGTLWIGTRGGGLNRFRGGKFTAFTTREGLFSDEIYEILEDDLGYFWMSCRRGIFRIAKRDFEKVERGLSKKVACIAFGKADGLASVQCNGVAKPAGWKARDGQLWFPTVRGVVRVDPRFSTNKRPPPVAIEAVLADKKPQADKWSAEQIRIPPGRGELEIHYTALSLQAPEKNRFRYLLEGADLSWSEAGSERVAHYNNLAPGSYRFRVIACNNDGVWNETGAAVALVLLPHYWQTWWFKAGVVATVGLMLGAVYRLRIGRLREIERLRVAIAANLHDDVGARLTKVAMLTEQVDQRTKETDSIKPQVRSIFQTTHEVIQAMDEIVWTINPRNDTLDNLANYIFHYAQDYFEGTGLRCRFHLPARLPDRAVSTEVRHNVFMAIKEALNNALKHSAASEVRVSLGIENSIITVTISDNGKGFDPAARRNAGEGLHNMKNRLDQIGGRLVLCSQPGSGTRIEMQVDAK